MAQRANMIPINEDVTLIDDAGASTCYLVTGAAAVKAGVSEGAASRKRSPIAFAFDD